MTNGTVGAISTATTIIGDDDPAPSVNLSVNNVSVAEAGGTATFTATLSTVSSQTVTIDLGFAGTATLASDYSRSGTQIVILAGSTTGSITVTAVQDTLTEANETTIVSISDVTNGTAGTPSSATTTITDDDQPPTDILLSNAAIAENNTVNAVIGTFSSVDPDAGNTFTYSLVTGAGGADNAAFAISGSLLRANNTFDFESKSSYSIRVRAVDQGGLSFEKVFVIGVTNINEQPTDIALSTAAINENASTNTIVGTFSTIDPDNGDSFTYSLVAGPGSTDNDAFNIAGNSLRATNGFDFESKNSYSIRVRTTDLQGATYEKIFTISVNNVNEAPTDISLSPSSISENAGQGANVGTIVTADPDAGNTFTYSLVAGSGSDDNSAFNISGGVLRATNSFNFESKNSYSIRVRSTDQSGLTFEKIFTIAVSDVNEPPVFDLASYALSVAENSFAATTVGSVRATDPDVGSTVAYAITGGSGQNLFVIDSTTGQIRVAAGSSLNFEGTRTYTLAVTATSSDTLTASVPVTVTLMDVNEAPLFSQAVYNFSSVSLVAGSLVGTVAASDPDAGASLTYSVGSSAFAINSSGVITLTDPTGLSAGPFVLTVSVSDGSLSSNAEARFTIVDNVPPTIGAQSFEINAKSVTGAAVGRVIASDTNVGQTLSYSITGGNTSGAFSINSSTGVLTVADASKLATIPKSASFVNMTLQVTVTDNGTPVRSSSATMTIRISTTGRNAPLVSRTELSIAENNKDSAKIGAVKPVPSYAGQKFGGFALSGSDSTLFAIDSKGTISVKPGVRLNFEAKKLYQFQVTVADANDATKTATGNVVINVTDRNEVPVISVGSGAGTIGTLTTPFDGKLAVITIDENTPTSAAQVDAIIGSLTAIDEDLLQTLAFEMTDKSGAFAYNSTTGAITIAKPELINAEKVRISS